jgi:VWFA-related protein
MLQESPVDPNPEIQVKINSPGRIELIDEPVPADSWVRDFHNVYDVLQRLLTAPPAEAESADSSLEFETQPADGGGAPVFVSQVRMVTLTAAVYDREGHPLPGLKPEDFEIVEDGAPQKVSAAGSEEVPFDLVLFLDLSGSTAEHRPAMMEAARRFVGVARPQDRVAIYATALGMFHVFSSLTSDRQQLNQLIDSIPLVGSGSVLYASIALCYAQESIYLGKRRSALVFLSDGVDSSLLIRYRNSTFAMPYIDPVFPQLRQMVGRMPVLFYPVLLPPPSSYPQGAKIAREQMQQLADASGGRLFPAASLDQLEPVYAQVADELRSVYTISYYPKNQKFDGKWRRVQVRIKSTGTVLRTRQGYYAW